jgi:hypothetical protein
MNNEGGRKWKEEEFLAHFKVPSKNSRGWPQENHDVWIRSGHLTNTSPKRYRISQLVRSVSSYIRNMKGSEFISVVMKCKLHMHTNQPIRELISQVTA